ncbi:266L [Invertebrate iridescent virus Kaz2018]|uniref:266L n=1 Tax=Invertebrate iridescent virus 6 TaxID=176652 RepID=Q91FQ7_IIV6|nr:266L [Invertebrate iridescent virus 6]AAK82127.1 266L [Invertebrate iridescent virus 6]QMS79383.1 hypothetical protein IIV6-T1_261 [Invertebrate iridescent virus 6]QNH08676.1 266L [Invertebrate iridescent virus Kaz2018]
MLGPRVILVGVVLVLLDPISWEFPERLAIFASVMAPGATVGAVATLPVKSPSI